jgi:hypothetical protein
MKIAGLSESKYTELVLAAREVDHHMGLAVCCESIELSMSQMASLVFKEKGIEIAPQVNDLFLPGTDSFHQLRAL